MHNMKNSGIRIKINKKNATERTWLLTSMVSGNTATMIKEIRNFGELLKK